MAINNIVDLELSILIFQIDMNIDIYCGVNITSIIFFEYFLL